MSYGYSLSVVERVEAAKRERPDSAGVQLGVLCTQLGVPVEEVASALGTTRQTVYNWFFGVHTPPPKVADQLYAYMNALEAGKASAQRETTTK